VPDASGLCELLSENAEAMLAPPEPGVTCFDSGVFIHIEGLFEGDAVDEDVSACFGSEEGERLWLTELPW
jgi:hypothetical protein